MERDTLAVGEQVCVLGPVGREDDWMPGEITDLSIDKAAVRIAGQIYWVPKYRMRKLEVKMEAR